MEYADIVKRWKEKNINTAAALEQQLSNFRIVFAYNSGVIENRQITYHHTREIFENGKFPSIQALKEEKASLTSRKKVQYSTYQEIREQWMELNKISQNRDSFLVRQPEKKPVDLG